MTQNSTAQVLPVPLPASKLSVKRKSIRKPVRKQLTEITKQATSAEALAFLNEFVKDARKEIRKRENLTLKGRINETDCDSVTFLGDTFSLTIDFKGGFTL
jgi:ferritin